MRVRWLRVAALEERAPADRLARPSVAAQALIGLFWGLCMNLLPSLRLPHVAARVEDGRVVVEVWDYELWDMLDDHFNESCSLEIEEIFHAKQAGEPNGFVFPTAVSLAEVIAALNRLAPAEVERVFRVNNPV